MDMNLIKSKFIILALWYMILSQSYMILLQLLSLWFHFDIFIIGDQTLNVNPHLTKR